MANHNNRKRRVNTVHVIEPEIVDENTPFSAAGHFPTLQNRLQASLSASLRRSQDAVEQICRVAAAKAELYENALSDAQRSYDATRDEIRKMGV